MVACTILTPFFVMFIEMLFVISIETIVQIK